MFLADRGEYTILCYMWKFVCWFCCVFGMVIPFKFTKVMTSCPGRGSNDDSLGCCHSQHNRNQPEAHGKHAG